MRLHRETQLHHLGTVKRPEWWMPTEDEEWMGSALCAQIDPEVWFPAKGESTRDAKRVCRSCEVRPECLAFALRNHIRFGIWGGMSERERRKLKPRPEAASTGEAA